MKVIDLALHLPFVSHGETWLEVCQRSVKRTIDIIFINLVVILQAFVEAQRASTTAPILLKGRELTHAATTGLPL